MEKPKPHNYYDVQEVKRYLVSTGKMQNFLNLFDFNSNDSLITVYLEEMILDSINDKRTKILKKMQEYFPELEGCKLFIWW